MEHVIGTVLDQDRQPVVGASVMVMQGPSHHDIAASTDENGEFELLLDAGAYTLSVNADGYEPKIGQARVGANQTTRIRIVLENQSSPEIDE
jgi:hypothetical protein